MPEPGPQLDEIAPRRDERRGMRVAQLVESRRLFSVEAGSPNRAGKGAARKVALIQGRARSGPEDEIVRSARRTSDLVLAQQGDDRGRSVDTR